MTLSPGHEPKPVVLVGFMASGKSTIGALLAKRLRIPFVDTDQEIERSLGMSVAAIFKDVGEQGFRDTERRILLGLLDGQERVIAAGGGAFVNPLTRATLAESARTVWLDPPFDIIRARLGQSIERPLAAGRSGQELLVLWQERRGSYAHADLRITSVHEDPSRAVEEIVEQLAIF